MTTPDDIIRELEQVRGTIGVGGTPELAALVILAAEVRNLREQAQRLADALGGAPMQ